jgi:hypothetical protein
MWKRATKQRFVVKELYVGDASWQRYGPSNWVWLWLEIKQNHWSILKKKVAFRTNLELMFKRAATDLDTQSTTTQQRLTCALKNSRLLPDGCCSLSDKGNEILFRIKISPPLTMLAGLDGAGQWFGFPGNGTSHQWIISYEATLKPWFTRRHLILKMILLPVLL